ncbi:hypothetical protein Pan241w_35690 [Gimesia alba]|uniref:Toprim domain-containing protein n=1 Tax=Gimesia alba TaxID=2527973 RepID=A0A517RHX0_9PLAN|nr:toprim domain-containing protein [Gimesia alba]QDT43468.1 hypothetical protein Pan241w_35690 [Gimesia alba]
MSSEKARFVEIDQLQQQADLEDVCRFYGVDPGPLQQIGKDIRTRCFLNCGKCEETGNRAIAIDSNSPVKRWRCHQYGCGKGGNLVTMCDLMKPGTNYGGKSPKRERFIEIREDLRRIIGGSSTETTEKETPSEVQPAEEPLVNVPLVNHPNERARGLIHLDERFIVIPDENMNRHAAAYVRKHPFLTPEVCREHRCGYLPRPGSGDDFRGGILQGDWVYCYPNEQGEPLAWFGRNLQYEKQHAAWVVGGRTEKEPAKFRFPKGFHRGLEVYGQHDWGKEDVQRRIRDEIGVLIVVEGPNDRIALSTLGIDAFAICSNVITREQARRISDQAREIGVPVGVMFDNDMEGENGARVSIPLLAEFGPVQYIWTSAICDGNYKNRQPESVLLDEWPLIINNLDVRTRQK